MKNLIFFLLLFLAINAFSERATARDLTVAASIKPLHSLVAAVMGDVGVPRLVLKGNASPHNAALKPSQAAIMQEARLIFLIDRNLETSLWKSAKNTNSADVVELIKTKGLTLYSFRENKLHEDEISPHDEGHDENKLWPHEKNTPSHHDKNELEDHLHHHSGIDPHVWLDPQNAITLIQEIAQRLSLHDSENAKRYQKNAAIFSRKIKSLAEEIRSKIFHNDLKYIVFHDAYQYFEKRFNLTRPYVIALNPAATPGPRHIANLQEKLREENISCVFLEPQFSTKLVELATEGAQIKKIFLDPLENNLPEGPAHYPTLLRHISESFQTCL